MASLEVVGGVCDEGVFGTQGLLPQIKTKIGAGTLCPQPRLSLPARLPWRGSRCVRPRWPGRHTETLGKAESQPRGPASGAALAHWRPLALGSHSPPFVWSLARLPLTLGSYHRNRRTGRHGSRFPGSAGRALPAAITPSLLHVPSPSGVWKGYGPRWGWCPGPQLLPDWGPRSAALWGCSGLCCRVKRGAPQGNALLHLGAAAQRGKGLTWGPDVELPDPPGPGVPAALCSAPGTGTGSRAGPAPVSSGQRGCLWSGLRAAWN